MESSRTMEYQVGPCTDDVYGEVTSSQNVEGFCWRTSSRNVEDIYA